MTTEEIKLIIEAVSTTTGEAKTVLIAWFALDLLKSLITLAGVLGGAWIVGNLGYCSRRTWGCLSDVGSNG